MHRPVLMVTAVLLALTGCGQAPDPAPAVIAKPDPQQRARNARRPQITAEKISGDLVGKKLSISEMNGDGPKTEWTFDAGDFRQVNIQEQDATAAGISLVVFVTTRHDAKPKEAQIHVSGKLELQYEWKSDQWVLAAIKNLTFRYTV